MNPPEPPASQSRLERWDQLTPQDKIEQLAAQVARINKEIIYAISRREMWARCFDSASLLFNLRQLELEPALVVVREALLIDLVITLARLYDSSRNEPISFPTIFRRLADPDVEELLKADLKRTHAVEEARRLYNEKHARFQKGFKILRNTVIAHNDASPLSHDARYGDETAILGTSVEIASFLNLAIRNQPLDIDAFTKFWELMADAFWSHVSQ